MAGNRFDFAAVTAVPEPSTYALLVGGLLALGFMRRLRNQDSVESEERRDALAAD